MDNAHVAWTKYYREELLMRAVRMSAACQDADVVCLRCRDVIEMDPLKSKRLRMRKRRYTISLHGLGLTDWMIDWWSAN